MHNQRASRCVSYCNWVKVKVGNLYSKIDHEAEAVRDQDLLQAQELRGPPAHEGDRVYVHDPALGCDPGPSYVINRMVVDGRKNSNGKTLVPRRVKGEEKGWRLDI